MVQGVEIEIDSSGTKYILNKNPTDNHLIQKVKCSSLGDIDTTIETLHHKQKLWKSKSLDERVKILRQAIQSFENRKAELQNLICTEMGKTMPEAIEEVEGVIGTKGRMLDLICEANRPEEVENAMIIRDPLGLVAVIGPWNYPAAEIVWQFLPALVAGNGVIVKPSEVTPLTGEFVVKQLSENGNNCIPIGLVQGDGEVGEYLVSHPDVKMIAMTGSSATGKRIMQTCSQNLKRMVLELGGKDPMIVFKDADLKLAAKDAVECSTCNAGQVCSSVERIYVDSLVKKDFEKLCVEECKNVKAGPPNESKSTIGPMVSRLQKEIVTKQVEDAVSHGAKKLYVGDIIANEEETKNGNYFPATILSDLTQHMEISKSETFGPVVSIYEFDGSEEKAIQFANDTEYGLSASVYTTDLEKGSRVASAIKAGQVAVNAWSLAIAPLSCPWIGHKESGYGYHSGRDGYKQFSVPKSIVFRKGEVGLEKDEKDGYFEDVAKKWNVNTVMKAAIDEQK